MPLPVGYRCSSTKNCYDYAIDLSLASYVVVPLWRALYLATEGNPESYIELPGPDPKDGNLVYIVKSGSILNVRATFWAEDFSYATTVIALY